MMFRAEKADLAARLQAANTVVKPKNTIPLLQHVSFEREGERLVLRGSDLDMEMIAETPVEFGPDFEPFTCEGRSALEFVRAASSIDVAFLPGKTSGSIQLTSGRARLSLPVLSAHDFPRIASADADFELACSGQKLATALADVAYAADTGKDRPFLCGVYLEGAPEGVTAVATNGLTVQRRFLPASTFDEDTDLAAMPGVIIPSDAVQRLIKLASTEEDCILHLSKSRLRARVGDVSFVTKLIDGTYPEWRRIGAGERPTMVNLPREAFEAALTRVMLANDDSDSGVRLLFSGGALTLETRSLDGEGMDTIECGGDAEIDASLNGKQVLTALDRLKCDFVELLLGTDQTAPILRAAGQEENYALFSPFRLKWRPTP